VVLGGRRVVVETTSPGGFDASPEVAREVRRRFFPERPDAAAVDLYADERGTEVDFFALLAATWTNLATARSEAGDLSGAEALNDRAERLVDPAARPVLRQVRASMVGELGVRAAQEGRTEEAIALFMRARRLSGAGELQRLSEHNLAAAASRRLAELEDALDDAGLQAFPERFAEWPAVRNELRARALNLLAQRRARERDAAAAAAALREASQLSSTAQGREVIARNLAGVELQQVAASARSDPEGAWRRWQALQTPPGDAELARMRREVGAAAAQARVVAMVNAGRCEQLEAALSDWRSLEPGAELDRMRGTCAGVQGKQRWDAGDFFGAAARFREAMRADPSQGAWRTNLVAALQRIIEPLVRAGRCREAASYLEEALAIEPADPFLLEARRYCARR
jgi:tetratricopeptide (TPR) repeat protein